MISAVISSHRDNELALRWYQLGVFSPTMRLHVFSSGIPVSKKSYVIQPLYSRLFTWCLRHLAPCLYLYT